MARSGQAARRRPTHPRTIPPKVGEGRPPGVWTDHIEGRYRPITVHQLAMAWWCHQAGHISRRQLRVWFAAHEMLERRRYTSDDQKGPRKPLYGLEELKGLVGGRGSPTADAELSADLRGLSRLGLVRMGDHEIAMATSIDQLTVDDIDGFWTMFNQLPHPRRSVPVPRRMLRQLAAGLTRGMTAVVLATLIRSLFWHKSQQGFRIDGRTKGEWIATVFGISARTVTDARTRLVELGWLVPIDSPQWMLNRYGVHHQIDPAWCEGATEQNEEPAPPESSGGGGSAPLKRDSGGRSSTPDLDRTLPLTGNQETRTLPAKRANQAGASRCSALGSRKKKERAGEEQLPSIRDVQDGDLRDTGRLLELHRQAVELDLAKGGEGGRLDFVALAERARIRGQRPGALFFWLLRERKTAFITQGDEDQASRRIKAHLYGDPRRREDREQWGGGGSQVPPDQGNQPSELSDEERFVVACTRVANQRRIGDPFLIARHRGWSREQWDQAVWDHQQAQRRRWGGCAGEVA